MGQQVFIQIREVSKAYGGVQALANVSMDIARGEIHALCGENGAGKSTLIKILSGSVTPDAGEILVDGQALPLGTVHASEEAGIAVIHQESIAFPHLSAFDNIFVGREPRKLGGLMLNRREMRRQTMELLARLGETFDPSQPLGRLSVAQRQMVGIARALSRKCRLLIMDEPTASLSQRETRVLFRIIRQLQSDGVAILYVSHRLDEVFELSDRVTVLRDGKHVATTQVGDLTTESLIRMMVGRELRETDKSLRDGATAGEVLLEVRELSRAGVFENVSLRVRAGEVVGLAGLVGAGRSEVARAIFGADPYDSGEVKVAGAKLPPRSIKAAMNAGIAMVPEDRQHLGLVLPMSVSSNMSMAIQRALSRWGFRVPGAEKTVVQRLISDLAVKAASAKVPANTLSGGNQQKLVLGKWLATQPRILILDEPTRGVDVGAKAEVHRLIRSLARQGMATLLISSDLPEILAVSDRILVMRSGRIAGELPGASTTQEQVLSLAIPSGAAA